MLVEGVAVYLAECPEILRLVFLRLFNDLNNNLPLGARLGCSCFSHSGGAFSLHDLLLGIDWLYHGGGWCVGCASDCFLERKRCKCVFIFIDCIRWDHAVPACLLICEIV